MIIGIKDISKLFAITVVTICAAFVTSLFINYYIDLVALGPDLLSPVAAVIYDAQLSTCKVIIGVTGGSLVATSIALLIFYIKNYIDNHNKELGILKALGYSETRISLHFGVFGLSVFLGTLLGFIGAMLYMKTFYLTQNADGFFPDIDPAFHLILPICVVAIPSAFFALLSICYAFVSLKKPVLNMLKGIDSSKQKKKKKELSLSLSFLSSLRKDTLRSRKILVFFIGFSSFCFSGMVQMSFSMTDLASETFAIMILVIGLILAYMTLLISLSSVVKANQKTIAMMKVVGYSQSECSFSLLNGYRPVSYIGFILGTGYQYGLLRIMVDIVFADYDNMPELNFSFPALAITLVLFIVSYETIMYFYSRKIGKQSVKEIMLEN